MVVTLAHGPTLPFRIAVAVLMPAELEEMCITLVPSRPRANVHSIAKAVPAAWVNRPPTGSE